MTLPRLALTVFAALVAHEAARSQVTNTMQQVSLCVTTDIGTHGQFCEPFQCLPNYTQANRNAPLVMDISGAPASPYVLFLGTSVPGCQPIAGIEGELALWAPISTIDIGMISDGAVPGPFYAGKASTKVFVPPTAPLGLAVRFQVLGVETTKTGTVLQFSRATEVRIH